jgi:hypothetical protein
MRQQKVSIQQSAQGHHIALNKTEAEARGDALLDEELIFFEHFVRIRTAPTPAPAA